MRQARREQWWMAFSLLTATATAAFGLTSLAPASAAASPAPAVKAQPRPDGGTLKGRVVASPDGAGVGDATVTVTSLATGAKAAVTTAGDGSFTLGAPLLPGPRGDDRYALKVVHPGSFPLTRMVRVPSGKAITVVETVAADAGTVAGTVKSTAGGTVAGATVKVVSFATGATTTTMAGPTGAFSLQAPALPSSAASTTVRLGVSAAGFASSDQLLAVPTGAKATPVVALAPVATASLGTAAAVTPKAVVRPALAPTPVPACPATADVWNDDTGDSAWETGGNWSRGVPTASTYACIPDNTGGVVLSSTATVQGLLLGVNDAFTISTGSLTISGGTVVSALQSAFTVSTATSLSVAAGNTLVNATGGLITNQGTVTVKGTFAQDAGAVADATGDIPVDLVNGSTLTFGGTGAGAFVVNDTGTLSPTVALSGNLVAGQSLTIDAEDYCYGVGTTTINAAGSFTNAGTITTSQVGSCGNGIVTINLPAGDILTNTGTLAVAGAPTAGNTQTVTGGLINTGTIEVGVTGQPAADLVFAAGSTITNEGTITVLPAGPSSNATASTVTVPAGATLTNGAGGLITNQGSFSVLGTFTQGPGVVATATGDNPVDLDNGSNLAFTGSGAGAFVVNDPNDANPTVALSGNLVVGQILTIDAEDTCYVLGTTTIDAAGSFTNAGTIATSQVGACGGGYVTVNLPAGDTLTNSGTLAVAGPPTAGYTQTFTGGLTNTGTLDVGVSGQPAAGLVFSAGSTITNEGAVKLVAAAASSNATASTLTLVAGASFTNGAGGEVTNQGLFSVQGTFTQDAGAVANATGDNPVDLDNGSNLAFTGSGAGAFVVNDPNDANPTVALSGNLVAGQILTIDAEDTCYVLGTTTIDAAGSFTNAGTIATSQVGACGGGYVTVNLPAGDTLTNSGTLAVAGPPTAGYTQTFSGGLTNTGTLDVGVTGQPAAGLIFAAGSTITNEGAVTVLAGSTIDLAGPATVNSKLVPATSFTNGPGGLITNQGLFSAQGTFTQDAGAVANATGDIPVDLDNGSTLAFGGTGAGAFTVNDPNDVSPTVALSGNLVAGQSLTVNAEDHCYGVGTTTINTAGSFTNAGTITVAQVGSCGNGSVTINLPAGDTLTNTGTLAVAGPPGGPPGNVQALKGSVDNQGTLSVATNAQLQVSGALTEGNGATLEAEVLGGPSAVPMLAIAGAAALGGTLDFTTSTTASLSAGQNFQLLTDGSQTGTFSGVTGLSAGGTLAYVPAFVTAGLDFSVVNLATDPLVTTLSPSSGPAGTTVTVFGNDLTGASAVTFGGIPATGVHVVSATELTAVAPSGSGHVAVVVTTPNGKTSALGSPRFTYAAVASGSPGTSTLTVTVADSTGALLAGVTVGLADAATRDPAGFLVTGAGGTGTAVTLSTGETIQATVDENLSPYGPASATITLAAGANALTLTLPIEPLVTSDPTSTTPNGDAFAAWPAVLPATGTTIAGGPLTAPVTLADVQFQLAYAPGDSVVLSGDAAGTQPFCVDGTWTLTLTGPAPATSTFTTSGTGCPPTSGPVNVGSQLALAAGTYGGEFSITAPAGATTDGTGDVYLLPPAGKVTDLVPVPGGISAPAQLSGSTTVAVGQSGTLNATLGGLPLPGATGYHAVFGFDPAGVTVTGVAFPAGWGGNTRNNYANGDGGFLETTSSTPSAIGGTVLSLGVTCDEAGTWPVSFAGEYWLPGSSSGYADSVDGTANVICTAPAPTPTPTPTGVQVDQSTGAVSVTIAGEGLTAATQAQLVNVEGAVAATTTTVTAQATTATATFAPTPPGLYGLRVLNGSGVAIAQVTGTPLEVAPALPLFSVARVDVIGDVPGIATTHLYSLTNEGTLDGTAVVEFSFPSYLSTEPAFDLSAAPPGSRLLLHGLTAGGWVEYVAVPVDAGSSADLGWTYTIPPAAAFGTGATAPIGETVDVTPNLAGQYTAPEWATASSGTAQAIVDGAMAQGMNDYTSAFSAIISMPSANNQAYIADLSDQPLAQAMAYVGMSVLNSLAQRQADDAGNQQTVAAPSPTANQPTPPPAGTGAQPPDSLGDPAATSFANFGLNTGEAVADGYGVNNPASASAGGKVSTVTIGAAHGQVAVGAATTYQDGRLAPAVIVPTTGAPATSSIMPSLEATWTPSVSTTAWTSGLGTNLTVNQGGTTLSAGALPFLEEGGGATAFDGFAYTSGVSAPVAGNAIRPLDTYGVPAELGQYNTAANFPGAWGIVSNFFPSYTGLAVETLVGILGLTVLGASLPGAIILGVAGVVLTGAGQGVYQYIQGTKVPPSLNGHHVVGSLDPNEIDASPPGAGSDGAITPQPITYRVHFENTPTATAAAHNVVVQLKLDPNLDPSTIQPGDESFAGTQFRFDPADNTITWTLPGIDLPPDTAPPAGEATVSFSASPKAGVANGTAISEAATVLFDFNPGVTTSSVTNTIDTTPPTVTVNPVTTPQVAGLAPISWTPTSAVGVSSYQVYVSTNGGPLTLEDTTSGTTADLQTKGGNTYGVAVRAIDNAGLAGPVPTAAQVSFAATTPALIVSQLRLAGPTTSAAGDSYVELYNNSGASLPLSGWSLTYGIDGHANGTINLPAVTLPAAGHLLVTGPGYSLGALAAPDVTGLGVSADQGVAVVAPGGAISDAVGMTTAPAGLRGGAGLSEPTQTTAQSAFVRNFSAAVPTDTGANANDFTFVATDAATATHGLADNPAGPSDQEVVQGVPDPSDLASPLDVTAETPSALFAPATAAADPPNRSYTPPTLIVRRTITNNLKTTITALQIRMTSLTTYGDTLASQAILAPISSLPDPAFAIAATTLISPPGGGSGGLGSVLNVTLPKGGLASGASVSVDIDFTVIQGGSFSFSYDTEALSG